MSAFEERLRQATGRQQPEPEPSTAQQLGKLIAAIILSAVAAWMGWWAYAELRPLFNGPVVSYWQALAVLVLARFVRNLFRA